MEQRENLLQCKYVQPFSNQVQFHISASAGWLCAYAYHPRQNALKEKQQSKVGSTSICFPVKILGGVTSTILIPVPKIGSTHPWSNQVQSWPLVVPLSLLLPDFSSIPIAWYIPAISQLFFVERENVERTPGMFLI